MSKLYFSVSKQCAYLSWKLCHNEKKKKTSLNTFYSNRTGKMCLNVFKKCHNIKTFSQFLVCNITVTGLGRKHVYMSWICYNAQNT